jgi:hypothetical protein
MEQAAKADALAAAAAAGAAKAEVLGRLAAAEGTRKAALRRLAVQQEHKDMLAQQQVQLPVDNDSMYSLTVQGCYRHIRAAWYTGGRSCSRSACVVLAACT